MDVCPQFFNNSAILCAMQERPLFVQPHLAMEGDTVKLVEFDVTLEGIIESYKARYPALDEVNAKFYLLWSLKYGYM